MKTRAIKDPDAGKADFKGDLKQSAAAIKRIVGGASGNKDGRETVLIVRRQFKEEGDFARYFKPKERTETMEVSSFVTEAAMVSVKLGVTIGLENFGSARIDVGCTMPCYREEMPEAYKAAKQFVVDRVMREADEVKEFQRSGKFPDDAVEGSGSEDYEF